MIKHLFTSESVTQGHPDKICDQISDAILDAILEKDEYAHVACETTVAPGLVHVMGEITTTCYVDIANIVRKTILDIGYDSPKYNFDGHTCNVLISINSQSSDIAMGVNESVEMKKNSKDARDEIGAGDQGMMFGFACDETPELMPLPISLAHKLTKRLTYVRKNKILNYLRPDGKAQVTVEYEDGIPKRVDTIILSTQHDEDVSNKKLREDIMNYVIKEAIDSNLMDDKTKVYINPTGRFVIGGPAGDTGLTGRKIIVDTYGGYSRHGGGAFSGKDPTKVDRCAAYYARYVAKNVVAAGLARKCEVQVAYAIGVAKPVAVNIETFGTSKYTNDQIKEAVLKFFNFTPKAIRTEILNDDISYYDLAKYGHIGRSDIRVPWERTNKAYILKAYFKQKYAKRVR